MSGPPFARAAQDSRVRTTCAHGDDATTFAERAIDGVRRSLGKRIPLAMQVYFIHALDAQGSECSQPHMQRNPRDLETLGNQRVQHFRREVQPCRRRGNRTTLARENGLIALAIGRQRYRFFSFGDAMFIR